ncbi:hypothetical protein [Candidatus Rhabdochlamydia sp. T3358]|uniref:hypothetical protein n=1 Tax=Candidatus Rhabdochlamydia sp. T3358 TaxID=2099795 RepID=UPI0010BA901E|nr:hypothetical protein [Candidatus Rhabdochlamydia sp. T3358]VHO02036.1 hypothetical protein RHT_00354 [Candidatus Rhabdochlamydia sp. T3358]
MSIKGAIELRFIIPQAKIEGIPEHNQALRIGMGSIYLPIKEGEKLLHLFCKDQAINEVWNKPITLPNKTLVMLQSMQAQFFVQQVEEAPTSNCSKTFRLKKDTISLETGEIEKLWNLFSKDRVARCALNNSVAIPNGTVMIIQKNDSIPTIEPVTRRTANLFTRCFLCGE